MQTHQNAHQNAPHQNVAGCQNATYHVCCQNAFVWYGVRMQRVSNARKCVAMLQVMNAI